MTEENAPLSERAKEILSLFVSRSDGCNEFRTLALDPTAPEVRELREHNLLVVGTPYHGIQWSSGASRTNETSFAAHLVYRLNSLGQDRADALWPAPDGAVVISEDVVKTAPEIDWERRLSDAMRAGMAF